MDVLQEVENCIWMIDCIHLNLPIDDYWLIDINTGDYTCFSLAEMVPALVAILYRGLIDGLPVHLIWPVSIACSLYKDHICSSNTIEC